jgi:hypothetical protein
MVYAKAKFDEVDCNTWLRNASALTGYVHMTVMQVLIQYF